MFGSAARLARADAYSTPPIGNRLAAFLAGNSLPTPFLALDLDRVAANYRALRRAVPRATVYYAIKANPAPAILDRLARTDSRFDVASVGEIRLCLSRGITPDRLSYGSTIKKEGDIAWAYAQGIDLYAFDCEAELAKIARAAPGARVFCRLFVDNAGAEWPLTRKFGCSAPEAVALMRRAALLGLRPHGLSFHVGSQQTDLAAWDHAIGHAASVARQLAEAGQPIELLNLGGGFPTRYRRDVPPIMAQGAAIAAALDRHFGRGAWPELAVEPGRYMVGDAGVIETEVVLIARRSANDDTRWVYLDIGRFGGLAETEGEAIKYRFETPHDGGPEGPVALAGPTCDSADILYEKPGMTLPLALAIGDRLRIHATGAYTTTYASQGFNGIAPLDEHYI